MRQGKKPQNKTNPPPHPSALKSCVPDCFLFSVQLHISHVSCGYTSCHELFRCPSDLQSDVNEAHVREHAAVYLVHTHAHTHFHNHNPLPSPPPSAHTTTFVWPCPPVFSSLSRLSLKPHKSHKPCTKNPRDAIESDVRPLLRSLYFSYSYQRSISDCETKRELPHLKKQRFFTVLTLVSLANKNTARPLCSYVSIKCKAHFDNIWECVFGTFPLDWSGELTAVKAGCTQSGRGFGNSSAIVAFSRCLASKLKWCSPRWKRLKRSFFFLVASHVPVEPSSWGEISGKVADMRRARWLFWYVTICSAHTFLFFH